jgi:hypothetical protein
MAIGWGEQELYGQAGTATEQGMHAIAVRQRTEMMRGSVTGDRIGIGSTPGRSGALSIGSYIGLMLILSIKW